MSFPCYIRYDAKEKGWSSGYISIGVYGGGIQALPERQPRRFVSMGEVQKAIAQLEKHWTPEVLFTRWKWEVIAAEYTTDLRIAEARERAQQ
jgi:hypothetical protein